MLIFLRKKLCLFAMTKAASTSLERAYAPLADIVFTGNPRNKHMTWRKYNRFIAPYLASIGHDDIETMCIMREPIDWLGSWYRYRARPQIAGKPNSTAAMHFEDFACAYLEVPKPAFANVGDPAQFVSDKDGRPQIDHLFAYDRLDDAIAFLNARLDSNEKPKVQNASPDGDLTLSAETEAALRAKLAPAYAIYDAL
jgi:hypothetical protein